MTTEAGILKDKVIGPLTSNLQFLIEDDATIVKILSQLEVELSAINFVPSQELISLIEAFDAEVNEEIEGDDEWDLDDEDDDDDEDEDVI
jgi:hypothetical protein